MKRRMTPWLVGAWLLSGCGGGDSSGAGTDGTTDGGDGTEIPAVQATSQTTLTDEAFASAVEGNADFAAIRAALEGDGYTATGNGVLETTDGHKVLWAGYVKDGVPAAALLDCVGEACTALRGEVKSGTAHIQDQAGATVDAPVRVAPVLSKDLDGADPEGTTEIAGPLTVEADPGIDLSKRELVIASAYGDLHGVSLDALAAAAQASGGFTSVRKVPYATQRTIDDVLAKGSPADALIWIGASVREPVGNARKTVGLTVNRGLYGDATYTSTSVRDALAVHPFGGPGLVVLLGDDTRGDGTDQDDKNLSLFAEFSNTTGHRSVVAVRGRADAAALLSAGQAFAESYFGGESLAAALDAGSTALGDDAELVSDRIANPDKVFFAADLAAVFGTPAATTGTSTHVLSVNATCVDGDNKGYPASAVVNVFAKVTFDGATFKGSRDFEVDGQSLHVDVSGIVLGAGEGSSVFVKFGGDLQPEIRGLTAYGVGEVIASKDPTKPKRIYYEGTASATAYTNAAGDTCLLKSPELKGKTDDQVSWIEPE